MSNPIVYILSMSELKVHHKKLYGKLKRTFKRFNSVQNIGLPTKIVREMWFDIDNINLWMC